MNEEIIRNENKEISEWILTIFKNVKKTIGNKIEKILSKISDYKDCKMYNLLI